MKTPEAVRALGALAQKNRLAVFRLLVETGANGRMVGEIAQTLNVANATLSFHLKELTQARLIQPRQEGRCIYYSADYAWMNELLEFLTANCCGGDRSACEVPSSAPAEAARSASARARRLPLRQRRAPTRQSSRGR